MRVSPREEAVPPRRLASRGAFDEALERSASATPSGLHRPNALALPELREAVRAVPVAIWSGQVAGARAVELGFGRDLSVELRQAAGGIELTVRAATGLERAARVDLPSLVAALRERGVTVVRAEVRGCPQGGGTPRGVSNRAR